MSEAQQIKDGVCQFVTSSSVNISYHKEFQSYHDHVILQKTKTCPFILSPRNGDKASVVHVKKTVNIKRRGNMSEVFSSLNAREWTPILLAIGITLVPLVPYMFGG